MLDQLAGWSATGGLLVLVAGEAGIGKTPLATELAGHQVTWVHSYVSPDRTKTFCVYDGPAPEAIRDVAATNGLPVDSVTEVTVLDPYFYAGSV